MNSNIYSISAQYLGLLDALDIDDDTGEVKNPDILAQLSQVSAALEERIESVALYIKNVEALSDSIKLEEKALGERRDALTRKSKSLRRYLQIAMDSAGKTRVETPRCRISVRPSSSVHIADERVIPSEFWITTEYARPDKKAITEAIKSGIEVPGAALLTNRNIQIK